MTYQVIGKTRGGRKDVLATGDNFDELCELCCISKLAYMALTPGVFMLSSISDGHWRISLEYVKSLDVVLDEYGYYTNIATLKSGETIFIEL